ncbi:hypothetical protein EK904_000841 [Melospiza melodia maxima]|nr:hypothetical protein EK904_000841 [Melospiza melodia maxima]
MVRKQSMGHLLKEGINEEQANVLSSSQTLFFITSGLLFKLSLAFIDFSPNTLTDIFEPIRHDSPEHGGACNAEQNNIKYLYKGEKKRGGVKGEGKTAVCVLQFHWFPSLLSASPCIGCVWTERDERPAAANSRDSNDMVASQNYHFSHLSKLPVVQEFLKTAMTMQCFKCFNSRTTSQKISELTVVMKQHTPNTRGRRPVFSLSFPPSPGSSGRSRGDGGGALQGPALKARQRCWVRAVEQEHHSHFYTDDGRRPRCATGQLQNTTTQVITSNVVVHSRVDSRGPEFYGKSPSQRPWMAKKRERTNIEILKDALKKALLNDMMLDLVLQELCIHF